MGIYVYTCMSNNEDDYLERIKEQLEEELEKDEVDEDRVEALYWQLKEASGEAEQNAKQKEQADTHRPGVKPSYDL